MRRILLCKGSLKNLDDEKIEALVQKEEVWARYRPLGSNASKEGFRGQENILKKEMNMAKGGQEVSHAR